MTGDASGVKMNCKKCPVLVETVGFLNLLWKQNKTAILLLIVLKDNGSWNIKNKFLYFLAFINK